MKGFPVIIAVLVGVAALYLLRSTQDHVRSVESRITETPGVILDATPTRATPPGMREYHTAKYHFSILYPEALSVAERSEGGGAATLTFQNIATVQGFQIFIVPYSEMQISEERFKRDEPSGVRLSPQNITLDGAPAVAFYSMNASLGETREVWFIRDGFLYEVTTLKPLEAELRDVLATWQFI